jgi:hypothetical protein
MALIIMSQPVSVGDVLIALGRSHCSMSDQLAAHVVIHSLPTHIYIHYIKHRNDYV